MPFPKLPFSKPQLGALWYWATEALTEFCNGCIAGIGGGSLVGVGTAGVTVGTPVGSGMSALNQIYLAASGLVLSMLGNGIKRVVVWHSNGHPMPNPWPKPAEESKP